MDIIRGKLYALSSELSEALFFSKQAEEDSDTKGTRAKQLEIKQRDLMKGIATKENDLDKTTDELERVENLLLEKGQLRKQADEDKRLLTGDLAGREQQIKKVKDALEVNAAQTQVVTTRADTFERGRKELEHRVMSFEDSIESLQARIKEARYQTEEATRKHGEVLFKTEKVQSNLNKTLERADRADRNVDRLEADLKATSDKLTQKMATKEKGMKRQEGLKKQMRHISEQLNEADHRADAEEDEVGKLELRAGLVTDKIRQRRDKRAQQTGTNMSHCVY